MVLYWEDMERVFAELKAIEQELLDLYQFCMSMQLAAHEIFETLEDLHVHFSELEDKLASIPIPTKSGEFRPLDDEKVLTRNPLLLARL